MTTVYDKIEMLAIERNLIDGCDNQKADADGWIEWDGGDCPVERGTLVDVKYSGGEENFGVSALTEGWHGDHVQGSNGKLTAVNWVNILPVSGIVAYRLHKPDAKPDLCKSVARSIPESDVEAAKSRLEKNLGLSVDAKPTIEQLAQDYRNAKDYADRLQKDADEACAKADSILCQIERAGEEIGFIMNPIKGD